MLGRIGNYTCMPCESPRLAQPEDKWNRDEKEDFKLAIEAMYEFKKKLQDLHPMVIEFIDQILQKPNRY